MPLLPVPSSCSQNLFRRSLEYSLMCGRYRLSRRKQIVEEHFSSVPGEEDWGPHYNIAPTQSVPAIRRPSFTPAPQPTSKELAATTSLKPALCICSTAAANLRELTSSISRKRNAWALGTPSAPVCRNRICAVTFPAGGRGNGWQEGIFEAERWNGTRLLVDEPDYGKLKAAGAVSAR
jgi:hypothetical protein